MKATPIMDHTTPIVGVSKQLTFKRTGDTPLRVRGTILSAQSIMVRLDDGEPARALAVTIVKADSGKYVAAMNYDSTWTFESRIDRAFVCPDVAALRKAIREYSEGIADMPIGFPAGDKFRDRQANLVRELRRRFDELATKILDRPEFAETV